ncbi:transposase-like protein [Robbsia andropogonis]
MPSKLKTPPRELPSIPKELIDQLASGPMTAGSIEDLSAALKKALIERALGAELGQHLWATSLGLRSRPRPRTSATGTAPRRC